MKCFVCDCDIPGARVTFLLESGINPEDLTCVKHSVTQKKKAIYEGEAGTSRLIICTKVYNDSVRSKFESAED